jgi:hypothetical protein
MWPGTWKEQTREKRGKGVSRRVAPQNAVPKNRGAFLSLADNKKELFSFLSHDHTNIISTLFEDVVAMSAGKEH